MNGWIIHKQELGENFEVERLVETAMEIIENSDSTDGETRTARSLLKKVYNVAPDFLPEELLVN